MKRYIFIMYLGIYIFVGSSTCWCEIVGKKSSVTIGDVATWSHPTKKVFSSYNIPLHKIELRNKKHLLFYVTLKFDPLSSQNDAYYNKLYLELLKANKWCGYSIIAESDKVEMKITWDKSSSTMHKNFVSRSR